MLASSSPTPFPIPWGNSAGAGYIRTIPTASQISITPGAASLTDGFVPLNFLDIPAGGIAIDGEDMNGILKEATAAIQWQQAGGMPVYNASFQTAIGGYPNGAALRSADNTGWWISEIDNNTSDPETNGANWLPQGFTGDTAVTMTNVDVTLTLNQYARPIITITGTLINNLNLIFPVINTEWLVINNTTGAFVITAKTASGTGVPLSYNANQIYCDGTNIKSSIASSASIQGAFKNLYSTATGTSATVTVTADEIAVEDSNNAYRTLRSVSLAINSAGSGANGLDTGTLSAVTWYSVWVIYNPTTFTTAGLLSLSATSPTLPSGYTMKARVGWVHTDGTVNKYPFSYIQLGKSVRLYQSANVVGMRQMAAGILGTFSNTAPTWAAVALGDYIPSTASMICVVANNEYTGSLSNYEVATSTAYSGAISANPPQMFSNIDNTHVEIATILLESMNLYVASTANGFGLFCSGWEDNL
jgi:hypothetical protein